MKYQHYDLGYVSGGATVHVTLQGNSANVLLLDSGNLNKYKRRQRYTYFGGHATRSPYVLRVPASGNWHVVVDLGGYAGRLQSSVQVFN